MYSQVSIKLCICTIFRILEETFTTSIVLSLNCVLTYFVIPLHTVLYESLLYEYPGIVVLVFYCIVADKVYSQNPIFPSVGLITHKLKVTTFNTIPSNHSLNLEFLGWKKNIDFVLITLHHRS